MEQLTQTQPVVNTILVVTILVAIAVTYAGWILHKKNNRKSKKSHSASVLPVDNIIILEFLKDTDVQYYPKYLSYFIYRHGVEEGLLVSQLRLLDKEYGECLAEPVIDWRILISQLNNKQAEALLDSVKDYIRQNHDDVPTGNYYYDDLFKTYLKNKASSEAKEIVAKVSK